ncbi:cyclase family protein [Clostridium sp. AM58-1XD]|uniref:cyclase family protein n=1 Tax=Clostridium sp. AM58-1XD TaxID=2292307 RepID=UPI000E47CDAF|nr:cyclase family protein [Clostridium sp. AM58-1XD]RGZ01819.1 cyclase family protein [Clostridium sp. AM58-1XD]
MEDYRIIDLTHAVKEDMPVYPGTEQPVVQTVHTWEKDGFHETKLSLYSHVGTHMDAAAHVKKDGISLDEMDMSRFMGTALVLDCTGTAGKERRLITMEEINRVRDLADQAEFLLFYTGWDKYWGKNRYLSGYPVLSEDVVRYLREGGGGREKRGSRKKGIGLDTIGADLIEDESLPLHHSLLSIENFVIIENLMSLNEVWKEAGSRLIWFVSLPLKYEKADGAPVRACAAVRKQPF